MTWLVVVAVGLGSFALRLAPLLVLRRAPLGPQGDRLVRHAGTAALTALIVVSTQRSATGTATWPTYLAVGTGVVLAARGASLVRILVCGGLVYGAAIAVLPRLAA